MNLFAKTNAVSRKRAFSWRSGPAARVLAGISVIGAGSMLLTSSAQAVAGGTDTWVGSTSANWSVLNGFDNVPARAAMPLFSAWQARQARR